MIASIFASYRLPAPRTGLKVFHGKTADGADHRFQPLPSVVTFRQAARVLETYRLFGRHPIDAGSAEFIPVVRNKLVLNVEALEGVAAWGMR